MYESLFTRKTLLLAVIMILPLAQAQVSAPALAPTPAPDVPAVPPVPNRVVPIRPSVPRSIRAPSAAHIAPSSASTTDGETNALPALKFEATPSEMVLQAYAQEIGRTMLFAPDVPKAAITLRSQSALTREEWLQAIEKVLNMNGIALLPDGEKFLKVVSTKDVRTRAITTRLTEPDKGLFPENGQMISQMVQLKHITIEEARKTLEGFKRADGQIQIFERTNSILITDTAENVNRMLDIIKFVDQPLAVREEVNVRPIRFAKAADIKKRLEEIVAESQKQQQQSKEAPQAKPTGSPGIFRPIPSPVPGVIRAPGLTPVTTPNVENAILEALVGDAERGVIRGKVQIIADERTNKLIIITNPENIKFFESIINVLDVETSPDVKVEVMRLENADAEDVAKMLNELIGNKAKDDSTKTAVPGEAAHPGMAQSLVDAAARAQERAAERAAESAGGIQTGKSKIGELSKDNIKILSNKRTNALVIMASAGDLATLKEIIKGMDIMLSQVLIETIFLEVTLNNSFDTGIDWVKRAVNPPPARTSIKWPWLSTAQLEAKNSGLTYFNSKKTPPDSGARAGGGGGNANIPVNMTDDSVNTFLQSATKAPPTGIQYFLTMTGLDVDAVVRASSSDSRTKVLQSPIIMTQDNKEATIKSTDLVYLFNGYKYLGGTTTVAGDLQQDVQQKEVGWTVTVTPRINEKKLVVMTIKEVFQKAVNEGGLTVGTTTYPSVSSRELSADIAVANGQTVILGGLVDNTSGKSKSGIPFLSELPYIGWLFGRNGKTEVRTELLVFLTPYVLDSSEELLDEAKRRREYLDAKGMWTEGWSKSKLAEESPDLKRQTHERAIREAAATAAAKKNNSTTPEVSPNAAVTNLLEASPLLR